MVFSNPIGWVGGAILAGTIAGSGGTSVGDYFNPEIAAIPVQGRGVDNIFMAPTIQEVNSDKFKSLNCEDVLTLG